MYMWLSWFLCAADCLIMSQWFSLRSQQCSTVSEHHIEKREGNSAQVPVNMQISTREEKTFQLQRHTMWCFLFLTPPSWWTCGHGEEVAAAPLILLVAFVGQPQEGSVAATVPKDGASSSDSGASLPPPGVRPTSPERRWTYGPELLVLGGSADASPLSPKQRLQGGQWLRE
jgi:hypothetical protein